MKKIFFLLASFSFLYFNCSPKVYYVKPLDWENESKRDSTIKHYAQYLKGWKFFIDPGHGGEDRRNKGPEGEAIEADLNLRVSLHLRDYLQKAGAKVILTRDKDSTIPLIERSRLANESGSDIFISVHHNALGNNDHVTNYTSTWYHAYEGHKEYNPCNHDIAKYIQRDLAYVMGNSGSLGSFDGTMSDYTVYPNSGFSVLRNAKIPAALIEGSFFSSYYEEQRLIIPEFNEIQAWGIFRGLGKYLKAEIPKLESLSELKFENNQPEIKIQVDSKQDIKKNSIQVFIDNKENNYKYDDNKKVISIIPDTILNNGDHLLDVVVENKNGNHSFPFRKIFKIAPKAASLKLEIFPSSIPPDKNAIAIAKVKVMDSNNNPVADSAIVDFKISSGQIGSHGFTKDGIVSVYIYAPGNESIAIIEASCDGIKVSDSVTFRKSDGKYVSGKITDKEGKTIEGCGVILPPMGINPIPLPSYTVTDKNGIFIIPNAQGDSIQISLLKDGYFGKDISLFLKNSVTISNITLDKICSGILFDKNIILDARYGGIEKGEVFNNLTSSRVNLEIAQYLSKLLEAAGANVLLIRSEDKYMSEAERAKLTESFKLGFYIRIDVSNKEKIGMIQYPNIPNTNLSRSIMSEIHKLTKLDTTNISSTYESIFMLTSIGTVSVSLPSLNSKFFTTENIKFREMECAWGIFNGIIHYYGYPTGSSKTIKKQLTENGQPVKGIEAILDGAIISVSDNNGNISFYNTEGSVGKILPITENDININVK